MPYEPPKAVAKPLLTGLGLVITRWAYVEFLLGEFLSFLLDANPPLMYVVTSNVSSSTVCDWIRTLLEVRFKGNAPVEITTLLSAIDEVRAERNALVHGLWERGNVPRTALVQTVRWERRETLNTALVTESDLEHLAVLIDSYGDELVTIGRRYNFPRMPQT